LPYVEAGKSTKAVFIPMKKWHHSEEGKRHISEALKGKGLGIHYSPATEFKKGIVPWNKGKTGVYSPETLERFSRASKGRRLSTEHRAKLMGKPAWNKGLRGYHSGPQHHNWKGGISHHPSYRGFIQKRRVIRKRTNGGSHSLDQWLALKRMSAYLCNVCGNMEPFIKLTEDHIIPLSKGGSDDISNIQPLCAYCNSRKQGRTQEEAFPESAYVSFLMPQKVEQPKLFAA
jgi:5-methylcytosine-specific restriction endonuclease McrA